MKKKFTFHNLILKKRLLGLVFLLLFCNKNMAQTFCRPISHTPGTGGACLGATEITNPSLAYDGNLSTYSTITNALGVLCYAQETLNFGQMAKAGDQIVIYYGSNSPLLDVGLLSTASIQPRNSVAGTTGTTLALNSPLLNLQLLAGNTMGVIRYTLTADADQVRIQVGGLVSVLSNLRVYEARIQFAKPTITGGETQSVCSGQSVSLTATAATGTTVAWYDSPTAIAPLSTSGTYTTPALMASTTYYVSTSREVGCESNERLPVTINVLTPVIPAVSTTGTSICSAGATQATTLSVINPVPGTSYLWYNAAVGGTSLATGNTFTPTVPTGVSNFYVEALIGSCRSARTQVTVTSTPAPALATVLTQSVTILSGQNATLNASTSEAGVVLDWYDVPTGGLKLLGDSDTFTTPILTASKTYYVESRNNTAGCVSATRVPITVTVQANPLGTCLESNSQQTNQNGLCLLCSSTTPNFSVDGNGATAARLTLPAGLLNGYIQQTLQFNNPGKTGDIVDVELALPGGIADLSLLGAVTLATYNGSTYNNDRVAIANNAIVALQLLSGNRFKASIVAGANFDRVEIRLGGVLAALTNLDIYQATYRFKAPVVSGNAAICGGQNTTLLANLAVGETVNWYSASTGGTLLASTASYTTPALTADTTYYLQLTRNGCVNSERTPFLVTVSNPISPVVDASPLNLCAGEFSTITVLSPIAGTTYRWYDAASGGTLLTTGTSFVTPFLSATTTYYIEASIGSCLSSRTAITVNVNPRPSVPVPVSSNVVIQSGQNVTLAVTADSGVAYNWYDAPTGGNLLQLNSSIYTPNPALTANQTYYVEARNTQTDCTSSSRAVINVIVTNTVSSCLKPNIQLVTVDTTSPLALCVGCNSSNDGNSVDGNINSFATLFTPVAAAGAYIQQQLNFPTPGKTGDIIEVDLALPGGLADVSLLGGGISLATHLGSTFNNDRIFLTDNLLSLQLLSGNTFKATFKATAPFDKLEIRIGGAGATLLTTLNIYEASYRFPDAVVSGAATPICVGGTANLTTSVATGGEVYTWYDAPVNGNVVASVTPTPSLSGTTTYYLEATRAGCTNSVRQPVTIIVLPIPTAADIAITSPLTATCAGGIVLTPTSALAGATFKYYASQSKTQEITTGVIDGVTYSKNSTTGALTISGLAATKTYYISVLNGGTCENADGALKEVIVNYPAGTPLTVNGNLAACGKANLKDAITNFDGTGGTIYTFYDSSNNQITEQAASNILISGNYFIQAQTTGFACPSARQQVAVTINQAPTLTGVTSSIAVTKGSSVTLNAVSNGTIVWYDPQGNLVSSNTVGPLNTVGIFTYTVVATNANNTCTTSQTVTISVIDPATCDSLVERVYANSQLSGNIVTGTVVNGALGADGDPSTHSTISAGLGLLGIGTTWQNLQWPTTIPKGTPVTVKLGLENSLIAVGQNVSVIGTKRDGSNNPIDIGTLQSVSGSLLNLLPGQNSFEYTFVPSNTSGLQDYDGIRVQLGSILSVAQNINVYDAYYKRQVTQIACGKGDIEDVFSGVRDLGVGALTATVGVSNPFNVADNDVATYATMFSGAGVLAAAELTATFRTPSMVGDSLRITISKPGTLLNLNLLTGFTIQLYSGNIAVGAPIENNSNLLSLKLLSGDTMAMTIVAPQTQPYDKVVITFGGVASVLDQLRVHTIDRVTNTKVVDSDTDNKVTVCPGAPITLTVPPKSCADYAWYDSPTGGNLVASGQTFTLPATIAAGTYKYYIQPIRYGCPALERGEVTVVVRATTPVAAIANVTINGGNNSIICAENGQVTLNAVLSGTPVLTTPVVYSWYSFDGTTSQLVTGETTSTLNLTGLAPGTYTYFVGVSSAEYCETAPADRKQVIFTILPSSLESDITVNNVTICHDTVATLQASSNLTNPLYFWYLDAAKTQPITNGTVNGITYTVNNTTGILTVAGLTTTMSPITYYATVSSEFTCQNKSGELKATSIIINDPATPTSTSYTQTFCLVSNPTVANIQVNEANVVWYTSSIGGTALNLTTPLVNGIYYGAIQDPSGCESSIRAAVTVIVSDPATPTTNDSTQDFCLVNNPTVANLQTIETNVLWYTSSTGGTVLDPATALANGPYYAVLKDALTGCESSNRLLVTVTITDPLKPTTNDDTQEFCLANNPTVANLQTNETNVVWYTSSTGGTALDSTNTLVNGQYFAALKDAVTGCESSERLLVTVTINDPGTPTLVTAGTQNFCLEGAPTFASIQTTQTNIVWYTALSGGTLIPSSTVLTTGQYFAAISDAVTGCESNTRLTVDVIVNDPGTPTLVTAGTQNFCQENAPTFASIQTTQNNIVWYTAVTGGTLIPSSTVLTTGQYFAAISDPLTGCESNTRLTVDVIVNDPGTPTLVTAGTQNFCLVNAPTFASVQFNQSNIVWYTALSGGTLIPSTTVLTTGQYYAAISDPLTGCESNTRLTVDVIVNDPGTPTLVTAGTQNFCLVNAPTFASLQFNQSNIVWYTALSGGTLIPSTTVLTTGQYYAAISDPTTGCESAVRLIVNISVNDPGTPTLVTAGTQNFCLVNAPTFASVQFNQSTIVWYTALSGGTMIPFTTALTTGQYFAAISDPATGCESIARLTVNVVVTDPLTPTTNSAAQTFCSGTNPTVANIQVNESNVVWYTTQTGGTALASTAVLTTANYYGAIKDPATGCESSVRLQVAVRVGNTINPTTNNAAQTFCSTNASTVANIQVNETNVTWYTAATGGTALPAGTVLTSGIYFGNIVDAATGCESTTRLQVTVTVVNPSATPTTNNATQNFCNLNTPTVANIQVNEANVVWYRTAAGGTAIPATTALTTGIYYGAVSSAIGCENPNRLAVTVNVNTPGVITTPRTAQTFCASASPTLASIVVNEQNVVWYAAATGGTPLAANTPLTATTYYAGALVNTLNGCDAGPRLPIAVSFENDAAYQIATIDDTPCVFKGVTYSIANGKSNYVWTINGGTIITGGGTADGSVTVSWSDVGPGTVSVTYTNTCDERTTKTLNVSVTSCSDLTITHTVDNPTPNFGDKVTFTITVNNVGEGDFINTIVSDLLPSGLELVSSSATSGIYDPTTQLWTIPRLNAGQSVVLTIVAEVLPSGNYTVVATVETSTPLDVDASNNSASVTLEPICLTVYNEFTPNNDGKNDLFRIDCIESYPNNELKVFNRYGALVYSKARYENDWNGTANVSGVVNRGDMLPTGTYFYVITIGDGTVKKGWLSIMR